MASRLSAEISAKARGKLRGESGQMQNLLGEFKGLYEGRLKKLEAEIQGEETLRVI